MGSVAMWSVSGATEGVPMTHTALFLTGIVLGAGWGYGIGWVHERRALVRTVDKRDQHRHGLIRDQERQSRERDRWRQEQRMAMMKDSIADPVPVRRR